MLSSSSTDSSFIDLTPDIWILIFQEMNFEAIHSLKNMSEVSKYFLSIYYVYIEHHTLYLKPIFAKRFPCHYNGLLIQEEKKIRDIHWLQEFSVVENDWRHYRQLFSIKQMSTEIGNSDAGKALLGLIDANADCASHPEFTEHFNKSIDDRINHDPSCSDMFLDVRRFLFSLTCIMQFKYHSNSKLLTNFIDFHFLPIVSKLVNIQESERGRRQTEDDEPDHLQDRTATLRKMTSFLGIFFPNKSIVKKLFTHKLITAEEQNGMMFSIHFDVTIMNHQRFTLGGMEMKKEYFLYFHKLGPNRLPDAILWSLTLAVEHDCLDEVVRITMFINERISLLTDSDEDNDEDYKTYFQSTLLPELIQIAADRKFYSLFKYLTANWINICKEEMANRSDKLKLFHLYPSIITIIKLNLNLDLFKYVTTEMANQFKDFCCLLQVSVYEIALTYLLEEMRHTFNKREIIDDLYFKKIQFSDSKGGCFNTKVMPGVSLFSWAKPDVLNQIELMQIHSHPEDYPFFKDNFYILISQLHEASRYKFAEYVTKTFFQMFKALHVTFLQDRVCNGSHYIPINNFLVFNNHVNINAFQTVLSNMSLLKIPAFSHPDALKHMLDEVLLQFRVLLKNGLSEYISADHLSTVMESFHWEDHSVDTLKNYRAHDWVCFFVAGFLYAFRYQARDQKSIDEYYMHLQIIQFVLKQAASYRVELCMKDMTKQIGVLEAQQASYSLVNEMVLFKPAESESCDKSMHLFYLKKFCRVAEKLCTALKTDQSADFSQDEQTLLRDSELKTVWQTMETIHMMNVLPETKSWVKH